MQKRRSGRNAGGRKKYVDDLDLRELAQISDEETNKKDAAEAANAGVAPNCAFIVSRMRQRKGGEGRELLGERGVTLCENMTCGSG